MISHSSKGSLTAVLFIIALILLNGLRASAAFLSSSMIDVHLGEAADLSIELSSLLSYADIAHHPSLQRASDVIRTKLGSSTTLQQAAARLIKKCRAAHDASDSSAAASHAKEVAKQVYAIHATDNSLATAGSKSPKACDKFCGRPSQSWFHVQYHTNDENNDHLLDPSLDHSRAICLKELYKVDNSWTSYSNHLQDANSLCEISSIEHAPHALLELLKDFSDVIPPVVEVLKQQALQSGQLMQQVNTFTRDMETLHEDQLQETYRRYEDIKRQAEDLFHSIENSASDLTSQLREQLVAAGNDANSAKEALIRTTSDLAVIIDTQDIAIEKYKAIFADATSLQVHGMRNVDHALRDIVNIVNDVSSGLNEHAYALTETLRRQIGLVLQSQDAVLDRQTQVLRLQARTKDRQQESLDLADQVAVSLSEVKSLLASAEPILRGVMGMFNVLNTQFLLGIASFFSIIIVLYCCGLARWSVGLAASTASIYSLCLLIRPLLPDLQKVGTIVAQIMETTIPQLLDPTRGPAFFNAFFAVVSFAIILCLSWLCRWRLPKKSAPKTTIKRLHHVQGTFGHEKIARGRETWTAPPDLRVGFGSDQIYMDRSDFRKDWPLTGARTMRVARLG